MPELEEWRLNLECAREEWEARYQRWRELERDALVRQVLVCAVDLYEWPEYHEDRTWGADGRRLSPHDGK